ncbi:galactose mutarotase [Vibrio cidicii]|uniref:Aldose 1-epimerase n=2 Tax=Vibrio cidicii TaxID=1763883 RepID=A0ABR5W8G4_9VIBR|nr:galactose-1-epimerase [Vibrio cidicii]KYN90816.1 galactose mutarotase [Vibrio cidicii]
MMIKLKESMTTQAAEDGLPARIIELVNRSGMSVMLMDIGATWLSCRLPLASGEQREVLLGVGNMQDFQRQGSYMGVTVGRYANRIANGYFEIDGIEYQVSTNQAGNCLHGGKEGFNKRRWSVAGQSANSVTFSLYSSDGDQGFPGNVDAQVCYTLSEDNQMVIRFLATTDKATPLNLTNHAYFNLDGADTGATCLEHQLQIEADQFLPIDAAGIPLGECQPVQQTSFDFSQPKRIAQRFLQDPQQELAKGYDHSYLFRRDRDISQPVARVMSGDGQVQMTLVTDKPAMQLYTGNWLAGTPNRLGGKCQDYQGLALETQFLPDSPNHLEWPQASCILKPQERYDFTTRYQFTF